MPDPGCDRCGHRRSEHARRPNNLGYRPCAADESVVGRADGVPCPCIAYMEVPA